MLTVETIARVRREHAKGRSVRAIARSLKLSRETVSKYLRSGETAPRYERQVQPYPQLAAFQKDLERLVEENHRQPAREGIGPEGAREALLLLAAWMPKKLLRGLTRPGDVGVPADGLRYIVLTMLAASGLMEAERRCGLLPLGARWAMGMLGAVVGSSWTPEEEGPWMEVGRCLRGPAPTTDLARWRKPVGCSSSLAGGGGGRSLLVLGFSSMSLPRTDSKPW